MYPTGTALRRAFTALGHAFQPYTNPASLLNTGSIPLAVTNDDDAAPLIQFDGPSPSIPRPSCRPHNRGKSLPTPPVSPTDHRMHATAVRGVRDPRTRPSKPTRDNEAREEDVIRSLRDMSLKRDTPTIAKAPTPVAKPTRDPRVRHARKNVGPTDDAFLKLLKGVSLSDVPRAPTQPTSLVAPIPVKASVTPKFLLHPRVRELRTPRSSHTVYKKSRSSIKERVITGPKNITPTSPVHVPKHRTKRPVKGILRNSNAASSASNQTPNSRPPVPPAPAIPSQASSSAAAYTCGTDPNVKERDESQKSLAEQCFEGEANVAAGTSATADVPKVKTLEEQVFGGDSDLEDEDKTPPPAPTNKGKGKAVYPAEEPAVEASGRLEEGNRNDGKEERPETLSTLDASNSESSITPPSTLITAQSTVPHPDATQILPSHMSSPVPLSCRPPLAVFEPPCEPMDIYHESVVEPSYEPIDVCDDSEVEPLYGPLDVCDDSEVEPCYGSMDVCNESFEAPEYFPLYLRLLQAAFASQLMSADPSPAVVVPEYMPNVWEGGMNSEDELQWGYMEVE